MLDRIIAGRTDLVGEGQPATSKHDGASLISWCVRFGDVSAIRFLLEHGERLDSLGPTRGLDSAAYFGHWRLCEFLIERGANVNQADPNTGETPLHAALCTANRPAFDLVVQVLLAAGADPNRATKPDVETGAFMRDCRTKGETALAPGCRIRERGNGPAASRCRGQSRGQGYEWRITARVGKLAHPP